jgi:peptidoglycan DL-endopeptidase CwlO
VVLIGLLVVGLGAVFLYASVTNHSVPCLIENALSGSSNDCTMDGTSTASANSPPTSNASGSFATMLNFAKAQLGKPYVYGSSNNLAYDCSSFTQAVYNSIGINIGRTTSDQLASGQTVGTDGVNNWAQDIAQLKPGDLVFYGQPGASGPNAHVVMYIGNGQVVQAGGSNVNISSLFQSAGPNEPFLGVRRYANLS